jgi:NAD(P)-dependent dehydrogenase (short-subunit alcohol dehydrogenase family)
MFMDVAGAVAVVTGGTGSIGPKIMAGLAGMGAVPVAWDLFVDGNGERSVACDVGDSDSVEAAMDQTGQRWGLPTVLVTAAAISSGFSPLAPAGARTSPRRCAPYCRWTGSPARSSSPTAASPCAVP